MTDREKAIEVLRLNEPMQKTHSLMETAICIAERESYLTDEEEVTLRKAVELAIQALEQQPCEYAISRQAVLDILDDLVKDYIKENDFDKAQGVAWVKVQKLPPVSTERTGRWVKIKPYPLQMHDYECSECLHETDDNTENYCSGCGAKMLPQPYKEESEDKG